MKKGFTIIEIIVVIGIVAILTAIILPSLNNIRAKNRDTERVADIAAIQLGLALYKNQNANGEYPQTIFGNGNFTPKYVPADSLTPPNSDPNYQYQYVPLARSTNPSKCIHYHLGTLLELPSGQVDTADTFNSTVSGSAAMNNYIYCTGYTGPGIATGTKQYNVRP